MLDIAQYLVVRLGGMEMAYEFFRLHPAIEKQLIQFARRAIEACGDVDPESAAVTFFDIHCQPWIESDRVKAQQANQKWA